MGGPETDVAVTQGNWRPGAVKLHRLDRFCPCCDGTLTARGPGLLSVIQQGW